MTIYRAIKTIEDRKKPGWFRYKARVDIQIHPDHGGVRAGSTDYSIFRSKILAKLWCRRTAKKMIKLYKKPTVVWVESDDYKDESD